MPDFDMPATGTWSPAARFDGVIDVSHHNGEIDWSSVKAAGIELAFLKATQGDDYVDPRYAENRQGAVAAGLMTVAYHFLTAADPVAQHRHFVDMTGGQGAVMVDWEIDPEPDQRPPLATMEQFCRLMKATASRDPLAYHGMYDLSSPTVNAFPWMVPKYGPEPRGPHWLFWQYSPNGRVVGIATPVDRSYFAGTLDELRAWWRDGTMPAIFLPAVGTAPQAPPYAAEPIDLIRKAQIMLGVEPDGDPGPLTRAAAQRWRETHP